MVPTPHRRKLRTLPQTRHPHRILRRKVPSLSPPISCNHRRPLGTRRRLYRAAPKTRRPPYHGYSSKQPSIHSVRTAFAKLLQTFPRRHHGGRHHHCRRHLHHRRPSLGRSSVPTPKSTSQSPPTTPRFTFLDLLATVLAPHLRPSRMPSSSPRRLACPWLRITSRMECLLRLPVPHSILTSRRRLLSIRSVRHTLHERHQDPLGTKQLIRSHQHPGNQPRLLGTHSATPPLSKPSLSKALHILQSVYNYPSHVGTRNPNTSQAPCVTHPDHGKTDTGSILRLGVHQHPHIYRHRQHRQTHLRRN
jgi:hypothetical protein